MKKTYWDLIPLFGLPCYLACLVAKMMVMPFRKKGQQGTESKTMGCIEGIISIEFSEGVQTQKSIDICRLKYLGVMNFWITGFWSTNNWGTPQKHHGSGEHRKIIVGFFKVGEKKGRSQRNAPGLSKEREVGAKDVTNSQKKRFAWQKSWSHVSENSNRMTWKKRSLVFVRKKPIMILERVSNELKNNGR